MTVPTVNQIAGMTAEEVHRAWTESLRGMMQVQGYPQAPTCQRCGAATVRYKPVLDDRERWMCWMCPGEKL